jgi:hypothetical protein
VRITNVTRGQTFTPVAALTHVVGIRLFRLGTPAIAVLEAVAEEGNLTPLVTLAQGAPSLVFDVQTTGAPPAGFTPPGQSHTLTLRAQEQPRRRSRSSGSKNTPVEPAHLSRPRYGFFNRSPVHVVRPRLVDSSPSSVPSSFMVAVMGPALAGSSPCE